MSLLWAVCLTGLLRTTPNPLLAQNVRARLLGALPDAARVDVFAVFSADDLPQADRFYATWPELRNSTLFYRPPVYNISWNASGEAEFVGATEKAARFYLQWAKINACLSLVEQREAQTGVRYDFFLRARSDLYYFYPVKQWLVADPTRVQTGAGLGCTPTDHFGSMPRHLARLYASAAEVLYDRNLSVARFRALPHMCHCGIIVWFECFMPGWLTLRGVAVDNVCDHEYELWRHTRESDNGTLTDFWGNVLPGPLVDAGSGAPWPERTPCSNATRAVP